MAIQCVNFVISFAYRSLFEFPSSGGQQSAIHITEICGRKFMSQQQHFAGEQATTNKMIYMVANINFENSTPHTTTNGITVYVRSKRVLVFISKKNNKNRTKLNREEREKNRRGSLKSNKISSNSAGSRNSSTKNKPELKSIN